MEDVLIPAPKRRAGTSAVHVLRFRSDRQGHDLAYSFLDDAGDTSGKLTYGELDRRARSVAAYLHREGAKGERVLLLYPPGLEFLVGFFGCLYAGAIAVPAYPPRRNRVDDRIQAIAREAESTLAFTTSDVLARMGGECEAAKASGTDALRWVSTDRIDGGLANEWTDPESAENDVAYLQYTSGSTSTPKGVMISHANLRHNLASIESNFTEVRDIVSVTWLPHFHDMGLVFGLMLPLFMGFPCHVMAPASFLQNPERWLEALTRYRATLSGGPNFAYDLCVRRIAPDRREKLDLSHWRVAVNGAEPLRSDTLERFAKAFGPHGFRKASFYPAYGMAEATLMVTTLPEKRGLAVAAFDSEGLRRGRAELAPSDASARSELVGCGMPSLGLEVVIADPASRRRCLEGEVGEIWIRGGSVGRGYWRHPGDTEKVFRARLVDENDGGGGENESKTKLGSDEDAEPFLRSGDLGFLLGGELFVTGRVKDVVIIRGRNHYPHDIEATMEASHPWLRPNCGAAFSLDVDGEERLVLVQEVERRYRHMEMGELLQAVRRAVAEEHEISPYAVLLLPVMSLPKTSSGKIQRSVCRTLFLENRFEPIAEWRDTFVHEHEHEGDAATAPGRNGDLTEAEAEAFLIERLQARAGVSVDARESFASYGLDSASTLELMAELERFTGRPVSPVLFWNYPTIESLAKYLARGEDRDSDLQRVAGQS